MVYSCGFPIYHKFLAITGSTISYSIYIDTLQTPIFNGRLFANNQEITIDISGICREYLDTHYEDIIDTGSKTMLDVQDTLHNFIVQSADNFPEFGNTYNVMYNYNDDYKSVYPYEFNLNKPISLDVDPRQLITIGGYKVDGVNTFYTKLNNNTPVSNTINSKSFQLLQVKIDETFPNIKQGDIITLSNLDKSFHYRIVSPCKNKFVLYYVNKIGGLDSLLCSGKSQESFTSQNTDVQLYGDRLNRKTFEKVRLQTQVTKNYRLNTGFLTDEGASRIDNLIFSPKVWIHNLDTDTITSCFVSDNNYTIKNFDNDKMFVYTFNVTLSQTNNRR